MARVVLAMSGGVDSSAAALLLREQGHDVVGLFMRTGVQAADDGRSDRKKGCCSAVDAGDARRVADRLDIPFYALDFADEFARVMDYFADEYLKGRTPNPCVQCNTWLKFGQLWEYGRRMEADFIATGHYARIVGTGDEARLHRALDADKDQSYVLFGIRREMLPRLLFPLGGMRKPEVREVARRAGLAVADKPDSVEICFVPGGDHAEVVRSRRPEAVTAGNYVDASGAVLGEHGGIERYTVGQRKGLGVGFGERRFVLRIVPERNEVVLGDRDQLRSGGLRASGLNWLGDAPAGPLRCEAKIRYRHVPAAATVEGDVVRFDEPQQAVAPGQAVVFYDGDRVLGGGWIEEALS
ncbi:MAG: tRNA 2-thiouridine(34) synthase MnmA [Gemmataceae bacterium]|nr:tRNA 2-thiouridine(34) synthase MnmA [Gemmataceae bacterium]